MSWVLGIDLGTSFTAAGLSSGGRLEPIALGAYASAIPSAVYEGDTGPLVGDAALIRGDANPNRLVVEFKRQLGDAGPILVGDRFVTAEDLERELGEWVFARASELEGSPPAQVVFTFPAFWGAYRRDVFLNLARQIVRDAERVFLVTEPEAAAAYYATRDRLSPGSVVGVYDLGGGTFDASMLRKTTDGFEVLGRPAGDDRLGGVDVDRAVLEHVLAQAGIDWAELDGEDPQTAREMMQLRRNVTVAKELLSSELSTDVGVVLHSQVTTVHLTRREVERVAEPLIARTLDVFETALAYASLSASDLHSILLVGAASRMPRIAEALTERFRVPLALDSHPKFAVCLGAAISPTADSARSAVAGAWAPPRPETAGTAAAAAVATAQPPAGAGPRKRRRGWLVGVGAAVVLLLAALAFLIFRPSGNGTTTKSVVVPGTASYTDTGVDLSAGQKVTVTATGTIHHAPAADATAGPDGASDPSLRQYNVQVDGKPLDANHAALIGKIDDGTPFFVGSHKIFMADRPGRFFLGINDGGVNNNSGSYQANVTVSSK
jgi:molecular chaperone DnaK